MAASRPGGSVQGTLRPMRRPFLRVAALGVACGLSTLAPVARGAPPDGRAGEVRVRAFELLNQGVAAYNRGEFALAAEKLRESAAIALSSFRAHYYLGLALLGDRRAREAIEALEVALDLDENHVQAMVALGDARLELGDIDEARAAYFRALKARADYPAALDGLARSYEAQANEAEAIAHYRRALASDRGFAPAYTHLGDLYLRQDRLGEAVRLLEEAVAVRPDYAPGMNRLALVYGRLGLHNEAVALILKAIELEPGEPRHRATLGRLQLGQGFITLGESSFREALAIDAALPEGREGLAEVARRRGQYAAALAELDLALGDERLRLLTRERLERTRQAFAAERDRVAELEARVAAEEAAPADYAELAAIYARRGLWEEAAALQAQATGDPSQQERRAYMLFHAGRYRDSHELYATLAASRPGSHHLVNDGVTLARLGKDEAAIEAFRAALDLDPEELRARLYLGNALLREGRAPEAARAYREYLDRRSEGEAAERVRRILRQIAPELLPPPPADPLPAVPPPPPADEPAVEAVVDPEDAP